jgi:hypothetical protein
LTPNDVVYFPLPSTNRPPFTPTLKVLNRTAAYRHLAGKNTTDTIRQVTNFVNITYTAHQSINQSTDQPIIQFFNQAINQAINRAINRVID